MPRPRSTAVTTLKEKLVLRLRDGFHRPGRRFLSNRAIASNFGVSYQTAHRLVSELVEEGWLERQPGSGTFVAGRREVWRGVQLLFAPRARRADSFGAHLLQSLRKALGDAGIHHAVRWLGEDAMASDVEGGWYPVLWERPHLAAQLAAAQRYVLVLEDRPVRGIAATYVDSVSVDDFSGGMVAAEWLLERTGGRRCAVLAGPADDARNRLRVAGFLSVLPRAKVVHSGSWFFEEARAAAPRVLGHAGVFCTNDRIAAATIACARDRGSALPELIGFDDAPVAESLNFSTVAIPWNEVASAAAEIARRRLSGDIRTAAGVVFSPRPLVRAGA